MTGYWLVGYWLDVGWLLVGCWSVIGCCLLFVRRRHVGIFVGIVLCVVVGICVGDYVYGCGVDRAGVGISVEVGQHLCWYVSWCSVW